MPTVPIGNDEWFELDYEVDFSLNDWRRLVQTDAIFASPADVDWALKKIDGAITAAHIRGAGGEKLEIPGNLDAYREMGRRKWLRFIGEFFAEMRSFPPESGAASKPGPGQAPETAPGN